MGLDNVEAKMHEELCIKAFPVLKASNDKINHSWQYSQQVVIILHKIAPNLTKPWLISYQLPI